MQSQCRYYYVLWLGSCPFPQCRSGVLCPSRAGASVGFLSGFGLQVRVGVSGPGRAWVLRGVVAGLQGYTCTRNRVKGSVVVVVCGWFVGFVLAGVAVALGWGDWGGSVIEEGEGVLPVLGSDGLCVYVLVVWVHMEGVLC